ncbi:MAG: hypothetical protein WC958_06050 [Dehalococcoidales bacterium]
MNKIIFLNVGFIYFLLLTVYAEPQPRTAPRIFKNQTNTLVHAPQFSNSSTNHDARAQRLLDQLNAQTQIQETDAQRLVRLQKERAEIVRSISLTQQRINQNANHVHSEACSHGHNHSPNSNFALQRMLQQRQADLAKIDQEISKLQAQ